MLSTLSLILAVPDLGAVLSGKETNPVGAALTTHLGATVTRIAFGVFAVGFTACALGLQTGLSRVIWAFARDRALPASGWLSALSARERIPARAVAVTAVLPLPIFLLTGSQVYVILVGYTIGGWYLTFALVLLAALIARARGTWRTGPFTLGAWSLPVGVAALVWAVFETVNVAWPREIVSGPDWYLQWAVVLVVALLAMIGWVVYAAVRGRIVPYEES
jgi:amino acid transporter